MSHKFIFRRTSLRTHNYLLAATKDKIHDITHFLDSSPNIMISHILLFKFQDQMPVFLAKSQFLESKMQNCIFATCA